MKNKIDSFENFLKNNESLLTKGNDYSDMEESDKEYINRLQKKKEENQILEIARNVIEGASSEEIKIVFSEEYEIIKKTYYYMKSKNMLKF